MAHFVKYLYPGEKVESQTVKVKKKKTLNWAQEKTFKYSNIVVTTAPSELVGGSGVKSGDF